MDDPVLVLRLLRVADDIAAARVFRGHDVIVDQGMIPRDVGEEVHDTAAEVLSDAEDLLDGGTGYGRGRCGHLELRRDAAFLRKVLAEFASVKPTRQVLRFQKRLDSVYEALWSNGLGHLWEF